MRDTAVTSRASETDSRSSPVPSFDSYAEGRSFHNANQSRIVGRPIKITSAAGGIGLSFTASVGDQLQKKPIEEAAGSTCTHAWHGGRFAGLVSLRTHPAQ